VAFFKLPPDVSIASTPASSTPNSASEPILIGAASLPSASSPAKAVGDVTLTLADDILWRADRHRYFFFLAFGRHGGDGGGSSPIATSRELQYRFGASPKKYSSRVFAH
jgi:hypothetical protein